MTTFFPDQPDMRPISEGYILKDDFIYSEMSGNAKYYNYIKVPKGFICDGASVPRIVWTLSGLTPDGLIRAAALVHDYLYVHKGQIKSQYKKEYTKRECDITFKEIMIKSGVSWYRANTAYLAVKMFGWTYWALKKPIALNE